MNVQTSETVPKIFQGLSKATNQKLQVANDALSGDWPRRMIARLIDDEDVEEKCDHVEILNDLARLHPFILSTTVSCSSERYEQLQTLYAKMP